MPDLTRFDFHVNHFMNSYSVDLMSAEEVGQYILLLCKAWQMGKDTCLPDDAAFLARHARANGTVSPRVMEKFPLVETEWGTMRRNDPLHKEWLAASQRSAVAQESANRRWSKDVNGTSKTGTPGLLTVQTKVRSDMPTHDLPYAGKHAQPVPYQPEPNQPEPNQPTNTTDRSTFDQSKPETHGSDWKNIALRHKRLFGKKATLALRDRYAESCHTYGETVVLACFDDWAPSAVDWAKGNNIEQPLYAFFKKLPDLAAEEIELSQAEKALADQQAAEKIVADQQAAKEKAAVEANVEKQKQAHYDFMASSGGKPENEADPWEMMRDMGYSEEEIEAEKARIERR